MTTTTTQMLEDLTPAQEQKMDKLAECYIRDFFKRRKPTLTAIHAWLNIAYSLYDLKRPERIEIVASPYAALKLASDLLGTKQTEMDYCGAGDGGWVSFYDFFHDVGVLSDEEFAHTKVLRDFGRVVWDSVLLDECAIVVQLPGSIRVDDRGQLHCSDGPCIEWEDGEAEYAWHGIFVPERVIMQPRSFTLEEYRKITNTEERRALSENAGWGWIIELLGAQSVNTWTDPKTALEYELLRCSDGQMMLKKQSPKLKSGKQPTYFEPVHEKLKTAQAARKWQATNLSVAECERDPALTYTFEA